MLAGLGHDAGVGRDQEDGGIHLGGAGDHVLHVVGVAGAVDVRVVAGGGAVLDVRGGDRDDLLGVAAAGGLGGLGDVVIRHLGGEALEGLHVGDGGGEGGLAMVDVADGAHVHVDLVAALKVLFGHFLRTPVNRSGVVDMEPTNGIEPATSSLPRKCSTY